MAEIEVQERTRKNPTAVLKEVVSLLALISGAFYAIARVALSAFYRQFGLEPEEAGWDTKQVLTELALPWAVLLAVGLLVLIVAVRELPLLRRTAVRLARVNLLGPIVLVGLVLAPLLAPFAIALEDFTRSTDRVEAGVEVAGGSVVDLLPIRARCVRVTTPSGAAWRGDRRSYLQLGGSGSTIALRDRVTDRTVLAPAGALTLTVTRCPPDDSITPYKLRLIILLVILAVTVIAVGVQVWRVIIEPRIPLIIRTAARSMVTGEASSSHHVERSDRDPDAIICALRDLMAADARRTVTEIESRAGYRDFRVLSSRFGIEQMYRWTVEATHDDGWLVVDQTLRSYKMNLAMLPAGVAGPFRWFVDLISGRVDLPLVPADGLHAASNPLANAGH